MPVLTKTKIDKHIRTTVSHELRKISEVAQNYMLERCFENNKIVLLEGDRDVE